MVFVLAFALSSGTALASNCGASATITRVERNGDECVSIAGPIHPDDSVQLVGMWDGYCIVDGVSEPWTAPIRAAEATYLVRDPSPTGAWEDIPYTAQDTESCTWNGEVATIIEVVPAALTHGQLYQLGFTAGNSGSGTLQFQTEEAPVEEDSSVEEGAVPEPGCANTPAPLRPWLLPLSMLAIRRRRIH